MSLKFTQQVAEQSAQSIAHKPKFKELTEEQLLVQELFNIEEELKKHDVAALLAKKEEHRKKLVALAASMDPSEEVIFSGPDGEKVKFTPAPSQTEITNKQHLIKLLGQEVFNSIAKVTLTEAKKYLSDLELADCTEESYGTRRMVYVGK